MTDSLHRSAQAQLKKTGINVFKTKEIDTCISGELDTWTDPT